MKKINYFFQDMHEMSVINTTKLSFLSNEKEDIICIQDKFQ